MFRIKDLALILGDLSQSAKRFEIKPPLGTKHFLHSNSHAIRKKFKISCL